MIKFGTDGWRAIIGDQYTFTNVARVSAATARWLKNEYGSSSTIVLGHDARFQGREFSEHSASVFASLGIRVIFADGFTTTPAVSWATLAYGASAGIVITASHNPPQYNGFKIKAHFGGPATPAMIAAVEEELAQDDSVPKTKTFDQYIADGSIEVRDVTSGYLDVIRQGIDVDQIVASGIKIGHDAMYGAGQHLLSRLVGGENVVELHCEWNPGFRGQAPEPIEKNLNELASAVVENGCALGIANDGDADRVGMYDEKGNFVSSHLLLCLLVKYLHQQKGLSGDVVKTFSSTHMLDRIGEAYGLKVDTTPIGFKYIASKIVDGDVIVGGEESGGMAVKGHIPERDGIYIGLLVAEMVVVRKKTLSELVQELYDEFGGHFTHRVDAHTDEQTKQAVLKRLGEGGQLVSIAGQDIVDFQTLDGFKHLGRDCWLLVRPSGTEPVLRIYSEASSPSQAVEIVEDAMAQLGI